MPAPVQPSATATSTSGTAAPHTKSDKVPALAKNATPESTNAAARWRKMPSRRRLFQALEAKSLRSRALPTRLADWLTAYTSTPLFLFLNLVWFGGWVIMNLGLIPGITPFDPYPFSFLTMIVSLEAIVLSIFVLISQARSAQIATLREELHLRVSLIAEQEITKILRILAASPAIKANELMDPELQEMLEDISTSDLEQSIIAQLERADKLLDPGKTIKALQKKVNLPGPPNA